MHASTTHSHIHQQLELALPYSNNKGTKKTSTPESHPAGHPQKGHPSPWILSSNKHIPFPHNPSHNASLTPTPTAPTMNITNTTASATCSSMDENEDFSLSSSTSRTVIASKRAAQNRAAQRAFRQRRERYIKDLEKRVKEMATWPEEIEHLRFENKHLREHVSILLRRISELTSQQMTPPLSSASSAGSCDAAVTTSSYHAYPPHHHPAHHITQGPVPHAISQQYPGQHNHPPQYNYALAESQPERFYHHDMPIRNSAQQPPSYQQHVSQQQQQQQENTWDINDDLDLDFPFDSIFDNGRCATTVIAPGEHQHNYSNQDMHTMDIQQWQYCTST